MGHHVSVPDEGGADDAFRSWLEANRLGDLADVLIANAIDSPSVLRLLNDDDFRELGLALGMRVRVREVLRSSVDSNEPWPPAPDAAMHELVTERRQITVMFADVVGSTALSTQVDPEDLAELLASYHRRCIAVTENLDGTVARFLGDGELVFFGFPEAHEDDPIRAVMAGLDIVNAVEEMGRELAQPIAVRVGIATGLTVVGDVLRSVRRPVTDVVGETPNLAARIQAMAQPGWVAIAESTRRLLGGAFELDDLGPQQFKGLTAPTRVFHVLAPRRTESRFVAREDSDRGPLIGRRHELAEILAAWDARTRGQAAASVLVEGEPGIGKSRLAYEVLQRADPGGRCHIVLQCSSLHTTTPFFPVIEHMWRHLRPDVYRVNVDLAEALAELAAERIPGDTEGIAVLADLVGIDLAPDDAVSATASNERRARMLATLSRYVVGGGAEPALIVVEDAHWADPSTIELIRHVLATGDRRMLVLVTARTGFVDPWSIESHFRLAPLDADESRALLGVTAGKRAIDAAASEAILSRSAGVPLYVEELTRAVCEPDAVTGVNELSVPPTLQDGLASRLDRLGDAKRVAQSAATIGRQFHRSLLAVVADVSNDQQLDRELGRLVDAGIIEAAPSADIFLFRHALIHEVAYETMLRSTRRKMHGRIADAVRSADWDPTIAPPALLAKHLELAGRPLDAAAAWLAAAEQDSRRSAISEAVAHCDAGLSALESADEASAETELRLWLLKAGMLRVHHGIGASDTLEAYERARLLCELLGDDGRLVTTLTGLYSYYHQHDYRTAGSVARQLLEVAERRGVAVERMIAQRAMGVVHLHVGSPHAAVEHLSQALSLYDAERHAADRFLYGTDHAETAASFLALALWSSGRVAEAVDHVRWAVDHADSLQHQPSIAQALVYRGMVGALVGDGADTVATTNRLEGVAARGGLELFGIGGRFLHGVGIALEGSPCEGRAVMEEAERRWRDSGSDGYRPLRAALLAQVALDCGHIDDGMVLVSEGLQAAERADERWTDAELHRVRGHLQLRATDRTEAEVSFRRATAIASEQGSVMFQLRALVSLASLLDAPPRELPTVLQRVHGECADVSAARQALRVSPA